MNKLQKKVIKSEYAPNCYMLSSFPERQHDDGEYFRVETWTSFLYDNGEYAAEWEPKYGPIQVWHKCSEGDENAREHYYYDYTDSGSMNWSQLAVDNNGLPRAAANDNFNYVFEVLAAWARDYC